MAEKVPEKIYLDIRYVKWRRYATARIHTADAEFTEEYILKCLHIDIRNEWFKKGLKAGKISNNSSGCCCVFEDDGETITNMCAPHKDLSDKKVKESLKELRGFWEMRKYSQLSNWDKLQLWQIIDNLAKKMGWDKEDEEKTPN